MRALVVPMFVAVLAIAATRSEEAPGLPFSGEDAPPSICVDGSPPGWCVFGFDVHGLRCVVAQKLDPPRFTAGVFEMECVPRGFVVPPGQCRAPPSGDSNDPEV